MIDVYTSFLWAIKLKTRHSEVIKAAFEEIFKHWPVCQKLETDEAGEFVRLNKQHYFEGKKIYWHMKKPPNKAPYIGKVHLAVTNIL